MASSSAASFPLGSSHALHFAELDDGYCGLRSQRSTIPPAARIGVQDLPSRSFIGAIYLLGEILCVSFHGLILHIGNFAGVEPPECCIAEEMFGWTYSR